MRKWKKIIIAASVLLLAGIGYGWNLYNKKNPDIRKLSADMELKATELLTAFKKNETAANRQYVDKILIITGKVNQIQVDPSGNATMILDAEDPMASVVCSFYDDEAKSIQDIIPGTTVRVKGQCTGVLMDVVLNKCSMVKQ